MAYEGKDPVDETAKEPAGHRTRERNAAVAIAVLAVVVVGLLLAIVTGATDAFRP